MPARIRRDDEVIVISGKDRGKTRPRPARRPRQGEGLRRGPQHRQAPPAPDARPARRGRRRDRARGADPRLQRDAARPQGRQADARRHRGPRGKTLPHRPPLRHPASTEPAHARTTEDQVRRRDPPGADRALRLLDADAGAEDREDHRQHGRRRRQAGLEAAAGGDRRSWRASPASSRASAERASRSPTSSCAKGWPSASASRCAASAPTSSSTA